MQSRIGISVSLVLSIVACASDPLSLGPSDDRSLALSTPKAYTAVLLGTPEGTHSRAQGIGPSRLVVGTYQVRIGGAWNPVVWNKGIMTDLGGLGDNYAEALAVNPRGQVVGFTERDTDYDPENYAWIWENGVFTELGLGMATDINPAGQVVGHTGYTAFLWERGVRTDLWAGVATSINPAGQIVGGASEGGAVLWENGVIVELGTLGGSYSQAEDINPAGQVVGWSFMPGNDAIHAFLWEKGVMRDLGTLGGANSFARAINAAGQIVGQSATQTAGFRAFIWENGVMSELDPLGEDFADARDINSAGQIVGVTGPHPAAHWLNRATVWTWKTAK